MYKMGLFNCAEYENDTVRIQLLKHSFLGLFPVFDLSRKPQIFCGFHKGVFVTLFSTHCDTLCIEKKNIRALRPTLELRKFRRLDVSLMFVPKIVSEAFKKIE